MTSKEHIGTCEGCSTPLYHGDLGTYDIISGVHLCLNCSPAYQDMVDSPEEFYEIVNGEEVYYTAETIKPFIDRHLTAGGRLTDKIARPL